MANRISTVISAFGVFVSALLFISAVREYGEGASVLWPGCGALLFLVAVFTLVRDVRRSGN